MNAFATAKNGGFPPRVLLCHIRFELLVQIFSCPPAQRGTLLVTG
ncbi:hypothetical protein RUM4293_01648 [Ruegeria atlantica]|uniref:Uncharacterized protein n=1 Tax=Ruegeria atlantica TaxID=81569 RepID=A0A0P1EJU0_9RHOB|nr:hypothetical protein RUM4293_01648 [Ruegeria atlantica]